MKNALAERLETISSGDYLVDDQGLFIADELTPEAWARVGQELAAQHNRMQWAIGDWLVYGARDKSKLYMNGTSAYELPMKITGLSLGRLSRYYHVAARFPRGHRHATLSHSHHHAVLQVPTVDQAHQLLTQAEKNGWDKRRLVQEVEKILLPPESLNAVGRRTRNARQEHQQREPLQHVECPKCKHRFPIKGHRVGSFIAALLLLGVSVASAQVQPPAPTPQDVYNWLVTKDTPARPEAVLPTTNATNVPLDVTLTCKTFAYTSLDVYLGTTTSPTKVATLTGPTCAWKPTTALLPNTKYYWKVTAKNVVGSLSGPSSGTWNFTTGAAPLPPPPPPMLTIACPSNLTTVSPDGQPMSVAFAATTTGGVAPVAVTYTPTGSLFPVGSTVVAAAAQSADGQTASCNFTVVVTYTPPVPPSNELVQNGTFESYAANGVATNWYLATSTGTYALSADPAGHTGQAQKIAVAAYSGWGMFLAQAKTLTVGASYTWSFWYKTQDAGTVLYAQVCDDSHTTSVLDWPLAGTNGAWVQTSKTFTFTNASANTIRLFATAVGTSWIDDMTLVASSAPPPPPPPPPTVYTKPPNTPFTVQADETPNNFPIAGYRAYLNNQLKVDSPATTAYSNGIVTLQVPGVPAGLYSVTVSAYGTGSDGITQESISAPTTMTVGP